MSYYIIQTNPGCSFLGATGGEALKYFGLPLPGAIRFRFSDTSFDPNTITGMAHNHTWTKVPGIFAGYCSDLTWQRDGVLMLNWTSTVVTPQTIQDKPNRFFCVCKEQIGGVEDAVGDATFMQMDSQTGNARFHQVVLFKN